MYCSIAVVSLRHTQDVCARVKSFLIFHGCMRCSRIRTWFASSRHGVEGLFSPSGPALHLDYWNTIEERVLYALEKYPWVQLQLIIYGEDRERLVLAGTALRDPASANATARIAAYVCGCTWTLLCPVVVVGILIVGYKPHIHE